MLRLRILHKSQRDALKAAGCDLQESVHNPKATGCRVKATEQPVDTDTVAGKALALSVKR
jgi:hypothetical protein